MKRNKPKLFVWDFHGTLEQGNELAALEISNLALQKLGYQQRFSEQDAYNLYGKKWYEYFEYLLPDAPHEIHLNLQQTCFDWPNPEQIIAGHMKPNDYAIEVLEAINAQGHNQILISNTTAAALPEFVKLAKMDHIFTNHNSFAVMAHTREVHRTKLDVLQDHIANLKYSPNLVVIGDSDKDMAQSSMSFNRGSIILAVSIK